MLLVYYFQQDSLYRLPNCQCLSIFGIVCKRKKMTQIYGQDYCTSKLWQKLSVTGKGHVVTTL